MCIAAEDSYYILQYKVDSVVEALSTNQGIDEDGIEAAFDVVGEIEETVKTGMWVGDCFIYTNSVNRLNYYVGGEIVTISHLDRSECMCRYHEWSCDCDDVIVLGLSMSLVTFPRTTECILGTRKWVSSVTLSSWLCWNIRRPS